MSVIHGWSKLINNGQLNMYISKKTYCKVPTEYAEAFLGTVMPGF